MKSMGDFELTCTEFFMSATELSNSLKCSSGQ